VPSVEQNYTNFPFEGKFRLTGAPQQHEQQLDLFPLQSELISQKKQPIGGSFVLLAALDFPLFKRRIKGNHHDGNSSFNH
jgi:hypothetical protein